MSLVFTSQGHLLEQGLIIYIYIGRVFHNDDTNANIIDDNKDSNEANSYIL